MQSVSLGPWTFPVSLLALVLGVVAAQSVSGFFARRRHADVGTPLYLLLILALLAARIGYVVRWWSTYVQHPWDIANVRDGGFDLLSALLVLAVALALMLWRRPAWRRPLAVAAFAGLATWAVIVFGARQLHNAAERPLPAMTLQDLDGRPVDIVSLRGKPLVINFWATWCPPCRREMPVLAQGQKDYPQVRFVFADQGEEAAQVKRFLAARGLSLHNVLLDDGMKLAHHYGVRGYPTTLFIGADGNLRDMHTGELSHATLRQRLGRIATLPQVSATAKP